MEDLPRPKRSLRDKGSSYTPPPELSSNPIKKEVKKSAGYDNSAQNYLSQIDQEPEEEEVLAEIPVSKMTENIQNVVTKPKVQVLDLRNTRKITEDIKNESKKDIQDNIKKVKTEFQKIEGAVAETKDEIAKLGNKIKEESDIAKGKIVEFGLKTIESMLTAPKNIIHNLVFNKKTDKPKQKQPQQPKQSQANSQANSKSKNIPKIKYMDLVSQRVEFVTYDKQKMADSSLPANIIEGIFMTNAIADVKYCSRYVKDLPPANTGIYALKPISFIFDHITQDDINYFLYYVSKNISAFASQNYKFSEAFATWIIRKSHEI
ncbi:MAG: hypothetical protein AABZ74_07075 [Cyanobacteriota bacterium]